MKNILSILSKKNILFASAIYLFTYINLVIQIYNLEIYLIREKSLMRFGGDISENLGFFDVLKSSGYNFWPTFRGILTFISYLIIAAYFNNYKKVAHEGWKRICLTIQILIPALVAVIFTYHDITTNVYFSNFQTSISDIIRYFGYTEVIVLLFVYTTIWIKKGFISNIN